jgi:hypothetical protein
MSEGQTIAVPSSSRANVVHYVSIENGHRYHCTCESFTYRGYCRHTDDAPASYGQRVAMFGYTPTPRVTLADLHPRLFAFARWCDRLLMHPMRTLGWTALQAPRAASHAADTARDAAVWASDTRESIMQAPWR